MRTVVVVVVLYRLRFHSFTFAKVLSARTERERKKKSTTGSVSVSLPAVVPRARETTRSGTREREKERKRSRVCIISNDYLVVVLVADDRSQSRDFAQSQDDEVETITIPRRPRRRRPHRPRRRRPPRCFGAGLLHRERERDKEKFVCRDPTFFKGHKTSFGSLSH